MAEEQQFQETNSADIASTRKAIFKVRNDIAAEKEHDRQLTRDLLEKKNWLDGHQLDDETLKNQGLLPVVKGKKAEIESLHQRILESKLRFKNLELNLQELEAVNFSAGQTMVLAVADYRESLAGVEGLRQQEKSLSKEKERAAEALNNANSLLKRAQESKKKSLSLSEVSKASDDETTAKRQVDELESLVKNLDEALSPIPGKIIAKESELKSAEALVWSAKLGQLLLSIQENPEFTPVFALIEKAFAAWVKAGKTNSAEYFLKESFVGGKLLRIDLDSVSAQQAEMANEMGLPS